MPNTNVTPIAAPQGPTVVKPTRADVIAILGMFEDYSEIDLTPQELHARETMRKILALQEQKHAQNIRVSNRVPARYRGEPSETSIEELEKVSEGKRLSQ